MKERPILFSGPMVRAILEGRKTQTRRVMNPQPQRVGNLWEWKTAGWSSDTIPVHVLDGFGLGKHSPYGVAGDRLWVRESFSAWFSGTPWRECPADFRQKDLCDNLFYRATHPYPDDDQLWCPSIHMPRWASRINLTVTDVRVERLQEIRPCDVQKEGVDYRYSGTDPENAPDWIGAFRTLWDKLNAKRGVCKTCKGHGVVPAWSGSLHDGSLAKDADDCPGCKGHDLSFSWGANPWVWVIEFEMGKQ